MTRTSMSIFCATNTKQPLFIVNFYVLLKLKLQKKLLLEKKMNEHICIRDALSPVKLINRKAYNLSQCINKYV